MWPATPSSKPYLPKIRNAAARRPLRYSRSSYLSVNLGGPGNWGICTLAWASVRPGLRGSLVEGVSSLGWVADGGAIVAAFAG